MTIQLHNLKAQYAQLRDPINARIQAVLDHGQYIMGPEIAELEKKLAAFVGVKHCVGVCDGTTAMMIAMMALDVKPGDEVITTPFTFIATGEMIALVGAKPVFVDIDPETYNIDPALIEKAITPRTRAILPVSLYGQCADMDAINAVAKKHKLAVIEDAAQSFGATYKGRRSGALSTIATTSFFPTKPLGCYGDGGACFTDDDALAAKMGQIRVHGQSKRYYHPIIGMNGRLDTLQAAVLLAKLPTLERDLAARVRIGTRYSQKLAGVVKTPTIQPHNVSA
jgi:UDP-2-acetamido-2-deoxy-ribo-hexuluronate aminotransferase